MTIAVVSNGLNIAGNAVLIWGFHLGVAGAAIATLGSRVISAVVVFAFLHNPSQEIAVRDYLHIRPDGRRIMRILSLGIPNGIENAMFQFGKLAIQSTVSTLGTIAIAAQAMTNILENLNGIAAIGIGIGMMTVVGQCLGAGRKDEAIYYIKKIDGSGGGRHHRKLCARISGDETGHDSGRHGAGECEDVSLHGRMDHGGKADRLDARIYSGIWNAGCRGCEVFDDSLLHQYVGVPGDAVHLSLPRPRLRTDRGVDRHVYRLDDPGHRIHIPLYGPEMARA